MKKKKQIYITKASGEPASFSEEKLRNSLQRAGAGEDQVNLIAKDIYGKLYPGISTKKIYQIAFNMLRKSSRPAASRYRLKKAIMELGPSGFPFEKFIAEILKYQGYEVKVGEIVMGKCVNHEIDVIAEKETHHYMVECKYHNRSGTVCDVKIPLYIQARFKDVEAAWVKIPGHSEKFHQGWVVTNTHFTGDAIQYGKCAGLKLIGWNYPDGSSLRGQIDRLGLYPITCLTSLSKKEKQNLLENRIVLCKEIINNKTVLINAGVKSASVKMVMDEATRLCRDVMGKNK